MPHNIDKIQRIKARVLSFCASVINPLRNLFCALQANAKANKPMKSSLKREINNWVNIPSGKKRIIHKIDNHRQSDGRRGA
jgi:hypothetical protein